MGNASTLTARESTVDFLAADVNNELVALYILDAAASHVCDDSDAWELLWAIHRRESREYERKASEHLERDADESLHFEAMVVAHQNGVAYSVYDVAARLPIMTVNYRKLRKAIRESTREMVELMEHFTPGNIIWSDYWHSYDLVIAFYPENPKWGGAWWVDVQRCDAAGNVVPHGERVRQHCTHPDKRDKVVSRA